MKFHGLILCSVVSTLIRNSSSNLAKNLAAATSKLSNLFQKKKRKILRRIYFTHLYALRAGIHFTTFTCEPTFLLPYLYDRISNAGGHIEHKRIQSFDELHAFDLVINCAGLGSKEFVEHDTEMKPIRGQVIRVKAPWIKDVLLDDSDHGNYIIPR